MSGFLSSMVGATYASAAAPLSPGYYLYTQSTGETQSNGIFDGQVAVMGYNSDGTIRAAYTGNSTSSTQGFIKPILFNPSTNAITFGTKVNCQQYTSSVIYGLKTVSETEYSIGTADATNYGITYLPNNNSPGPLVSVYPFSMDSTGAVTVGTYATLSLTNVGTAAAATDIAFDGLYGGVPRYTLFSRYDFGSANMYAISRSANTLSITRAFNSSFGTGSRAVAEASFAGVGEASGIFLNTGIDVSAATFGATTRNSAGLATGIGGVFPNLVLITSGTSAKYMIYGSNSGGTTMTSRIINATYSASVTPTVSLGSSLYQENASTRTSQTYKLVKSWNTNEAFLFFIESNTLKVKTATVSGDTITWSSATSIGALTATSFDIMTARVDAANQYFMGVSSDAGNTTAFAVRLQA